MADKFYLSLWLKEYSEGQMLQRLGTLLETFPYSQQRPKARSLRVYPLSFNEHPVLEEDFPDGVETPQLLALAAEFLHGDCACEVGAFWDLWVFRKNGGPAAWKREPQAVSLFCYGPDFEEGAADRGHLEVDFGLDTPFRFGQRAPGAEARSLAGDYHLRLQENVTQLLDLIRALEKRLPVAKRWLWTETGGNFAEALKQSFGQE